MIITQNAQSAHEFQNHAIKSCSVKDLIAEKLAKINFISPTEFGHWEATTTNKEVVGLIDMNLGDGKYSGKWKSVVFGWGAEYHDSYQEAEETFFKEYARFLSTKIQNN